jgi:beta-glucosidase/6-phospho-beta-glucosidase/beta-galactosidase
MHVPSVFQSFFLGGFECSTHRRADGRRLDLIVATGHERHAADDYASMRAHGIRSVRDGIRWHLVETAPGRYDWSSLLPMLRAAHAQGVQVIWDLCHYGWPDDIDIWRPPFVERFARYAAAAARLIREETGQAPWLAPLNEMSYWAWAGGDQAIFNPLARGRGPELTHPRVRASIAAIEAIRAVEPQARFVQVDPVIHVVGRTAAEQAGAEAHRQAQFEAWDLLCGKQWPGLGGRPEYLDIVGVNYYSDNQWYHGGETIRLGEPGYRPFHGILAELYQRYRRPVLVAETGAECEARSPWLRYVAGEVAQALERGIPVEGICLYPILDYPGWADERHCQVGLLGFPDAAGERPLHAGLAEELQSQQLRIAGLAQAAGSYLS